MADRIKGITVEIGGDTTGLKKALSGVNKEIRDTQKDLKDVERLLKLDPTNTKLLEQRQRLLGQAVNETKGKLDTLKEAEKQVQQQFAEGKVSQQRYDALQREIVATEKELGKLETAANSANSKLAEIAATASKVASGAQSVANATRGLSTAAAAGVAGLGAMAYKAGQTADDLNTLSKQSGFTTKELQRWQYASDLVDVSMDDIVSSARKMKVNMTSSSTSVTDAWARLGVSVKDNNGNLRDSTDVFYDVIAALGKVENETERDTLAMALFGKSADSLAGIVDDGGQSLRQLGDEAESAGLILSQDALDSANKFNDGIDTLKAKAAAAFMESGAALSENLLPMLEGLVEKIGGLLEWVAKLDGGTLAFIGTVLLVVAAISPVASTIASIMTLVSTITPLISTLSTTVLPAVQGALSNVWATLLANPIIIVIAAIVAFVALIAAKGDEIKAIIQRVDDFLHGVFAMDWQTIFGSTLGNVLNAFSATVSNIWNAIKRVFDGVIDFIRGVFTGDWERAWNGVRDIFGGIFDGLAGIASAPLNAIIGLVNAAIGGINSLIRGVNKLPGVNIPTLGQIPYLAKGGTVSSGSAIVGEAGPELLTVAHGKTIVQPLGGNTTHNTTMGGVNINVYATDGQDVNTLADVIMEKMQKATTRRGASWA